MKWKAHWEESSFKLTYKSLLANVVGCCLRDVFEVCPPKTVFGFGGIYESWGDKI